jgi:scyllo-inositol 2-dehydrogenase (NADP+)
MTRLALVTALSAPDVHEAVAGVADYLSRAGIEVVAAGDQDASRADATLLVADRLILVRGAATDPGDADALTELAGVVTGSRTPHHRIRLRPHADSSIASRWPDELTVVDSLLTVDKVLDDVDVIAAAMIGLAEHPVLSWRPSTGVGLCTLGPTPQTLSAPEFRRLLHRWVRHALDIADGPDVRVGILGYGAIGHEHNHAIANVDGLKLVAACDQNPLRLSAAAELAPGLSTFGDGEDLLESADVDLVIVSTPPNTHAHWAMRALEMGKHVVVEKPFCLTTAEADEMVAAAAASSRTLTVYQNRRWDADYLALKKLVRDGAIGEVFHYESFVGGFGHPCNFWHSDEEVSGGAIYDWGSHHLDWVLDLLPQEVEHVTAAAHKLVWHDVTNADHSRVTVRFVNGAEAEFVHSDLAAAMKPKWYVLGTEGALVGHWRHERVISRNAVGNLVEDRLAAPESPADLMLHGPDGSVTSVAISPAPSHPFHRELADHLICGTPMSVTPAGSRRNIAVMEAATVSAREHGRPVTPL